MAQFKTIYRLYQFDRPIELVFDSQTLRTTTTDNRSMNNQRIKLHKGVDNSIPFKVTNPDRKLQNVDHYVVRGYIVDSNTNEVVLTKNMHPTGKKGMLELEVTEGDLLELPEGFYELAVVSTEDLIPETTGEVIGKPFFSNLENDMKIPLWVVETIDQAPRPSYVVEPDDWFPLTAFELPIIMYTSPFPANRVHKQDNGLHSFSMRLRNYTGKLEVLGSMDSTPAAHPHDDFFPVPFDDGNYQVEFEDFTGIVHFNFNAQLQWIRFKRTEGSETGSDRRDRRFKQLKGVSDDTDNIGEIEKLILRS